MIHKTTGIILHTTNYSEKSLIVKAYTRHFGLQSYIINDVRSKNSKNKVTLFQPLTLLDMVVSNTNKGKLQRISEISVHHPYNTIPYHIIKSSIAIFINEILYKAIKEEHADEELFEFIKSSLLMLDLEIGNCSNFHIYFMIQLSRYLGFYPEGKHTSATRAFDLQEGRFVDHEPHHTHYLNALNSKLLYDLIAAGHEKYNGIMLSKQQRKQLILALITFYQLHISSFGEIRSYSVLEEVIG